MILNCRLTVGRKVAVNSTRAKISPLHLEEGAREGRPNSRIGDTYGSSARGVDREASLFAMRRTQAA
jgi:hypothetical protein